MAEQEEQPIAGRSLTGQAVALARLLHHECTSLLRLYTERETFLSSYTPDGKRLVSPSPESEEPSTEEQVQLLHSALRQCLGLLHRVIQKEEEEWGKLEDEYESMRKSVQARLEHLLYSTKGLVQTDGTNLEVTPDNQCNEETDGSGGVFGFKLWTYRVLLELIHWSDHAAKTLHVLHTEREGAEEA
ncbi:ciliary neurotrophic factor [Oreochromis niloticus]|uniref:Ciliary neurotrophic factor n=1 Tax=Oreochromis niloticus TaxID=8128 RepID=A0A669EYR7_ORENI|nr:ciliary neurotrophic factor [Oreochromis niloticus]CAI5668761.1 unnamed protein product [Mustela putorius furo]